MEIARRGHEWDGSSKYLTKDFEGCEWYREIGGREICGWGVALKYLVEAEKPRRCEVKNRGEGRFPSMDYLDRLIQDSS